MTTDRTPRTIVALGLVAAFVASCTTTPAHAGERHPRPIVHGPSETFIRIVTPKATMGTPAPKATPSTPTPAHVCKAPGLYPLTFDSPALPPSTYLHPAYPEARPVAASSSSYGHGTTRTHGTVHTPHGSVTFDSTTRH